ncbi:MAG: PAS domain-containing protein, partial [Defluviitaleaceae bacterium]|nr:PAS domain-containing protein [Defluviitaleaceae bacterium]
PVAISLWDDDHNFVDCNNAMLTMLGIKDKEEYIRRLPDLMPKHQPDGQASLVKGADTMRQALEEGRAQLEWVYRDTKGEIVPTDQILVRVGVDGKPFVAVYSRDLRDIRNAMEREMETGERIRLLYDAAPYAVNFWNDNLQIVDCNQEAVKMFELENKQEYLDRYEQLSPDTQPDGTNSSEMMQIHVYNTLSNGFSRFEWLHQKPDGSPIECEVTLVRVVHRGNYLVAGYARDLRELRASMEREREAGERLRLLFDVTPLAANLWNEDGKLEDCNSESLRMFGLQSKEEYLSNFHALSPEKQPGGTPSMTLMEFYVKNALRRGSAKFEWMHQRPDQTPIPCEVVLVRIRHRDSYAVAGYARDMRDIKRAMERENEANDRAKMLIEHVPIGVELWDEEMNLIDCNNELLMIVGADDPADFIANYPMFSADVQPCGTPSMQKSLEIVGKAMADGFHTVEWLYRNKGGEIIPCNVSLIRAKYRDKVQVVAYAHDLRETNKMLVRMREADERSNLMLNATPLACYLINKESGVIDCNMEVLNLFEFSNKQEAIDSYASLLPERQEDGDNSGEVFDNYMNIVLNEGYCRFEFTYMKQNRELIPCNITLVRLDYRDTHAVAGYIQDLREVKRMIQEMKRIEVAEENSQAKTKFLARMSHEIRTPMNAILGIADIQLQNEFIAPDLEDVFGKIHSSASSLLRLINDILDLSKIEAGKMELVQNGYHVVSFIDDTVQLNLMHLGHKPIEFRLSVDANLPAVLYGDELRIKQILNNLLSNAIKYTNEGTVELSFYVIPGSAANMVYLGITISDTGQGMSQAQLDSLYGEYLRFNEQTNRDVEGTGLGMTIVNNLVRLMDAQIHVDSEVGKGTKFTVLIPQEDLYGTPIGEETAANLERFEPGRRDKVRERIDYEHMPYGKVLVVDDTESNLYVAQGLLKPYGLTVEIASSGFEAIEKVVSGHSYDIIFMDHMMPKMDGMETTAILRKKGYDEPIIALTANAVVGQAEMFLRNGFSEFISKPIDIYQLNLLLNRFIRDKQTPEVLEAARRQRSGTLNSSDELSEKLIASFLRDTKKALAVIEGVMSHDKNVDDHGEDIKMYIISTHAMKSALANIRRHELSKLAGKLEQAGRDKDMDTVFDETPRFIESLRKTVLELTPEDAAPAEDSDPELLHIRLGEIFTACQEFNKKAARKALEDLHEKQWSPATKDLLEKLSEMLLHSEFEEAAQLAESAYMQT